ncbi:ornithine carbamoyltransferase [Candidatus Gottesmanbacteria bacterium RIFCSPLOWO2_01_FULL_49_10]|uniref:Ornithine carbamoyltransferase n=1 Tax=Candidatus Gottesmanbacteria bacterium RIFCSPLOWO2_01_FULL_49_10 TaxID=1798396 RepID=A0A1F6B144_9BACT|nr:MAG: Ornithine carbamoyltransferase, catabolic [Microgenomates group bacterium GW2011_GWA2_47_8]OGG30664.1 MAG: ornithine carbamoyltransferase [Candidatus Gottesmanbacteria bacterium RIFCSPLOWO2_01_FULL_49_10]
MNKHHFLSITDFTVPVMERIFEEAHELKKEVKAGKLRKILSGKTLIMIFEKPSLRTRLSFEISMTQLGGHAIYLAPSDIGLGVRESVSDVAKAASRMGDIIMARTFKHETVVELARHSHVPVINGLSDMEHPCQILADLLTIAEYKEKLAGLKLAFVGDGENNVTHSLALASGLLGIHFSVASPKGYAMLPQVAQAATKLAKTSGGSMIQVTNPVRAVTDADVVYTDTWISMGDEAEKTKRLQIFAPYQVTQKLMKHAKPDAIFMHDLPAYRGNEVAAEVIDGAQSVVFDQAENRLHAQKALVVYLLGVV